MNTQKVGKIIRSLRQEKGLTQKQLADMMNLSDKAVSKWERGLGMPDVGYLTDLSEILGVSLNQMLCGNLSESNIEGGNMKKSKYFVCPVCKNISVCTGNAQVNCCGRALQPLAPQKADDKNKLTVENIEDDWFISSTHSMQKDNYIEFVAFATGDKIQLVKQYPEWNLQLRLQKRGHGMLLWYSHQDGLLYQLL